MPDPPKETKVPWRKVRDKFAEILRYLRATKPIPGGLLEITPMGFKVPEPVYPEHHAQFEPSVYALNDTTCQLYINEGYVYGPHWDDPADGKLVDRLAIYEQFPIVPTVNGTKLTETLTSGERNYLTLDNDRVNLIYLELTWAGFPDAQLGSDTYLDTSGSPDADLVWGFKAETGLEVSHSGTHDVTDKSAGAGINPGVVTQIKELNYHLASAQFVARSHVDGGTWHSESPDPLPTETILTSFILAGFYVIDQYGFSTESAWFLEGPVWAHRYPRIGSTSTGFRTGGDPPPPVLIDSVAEAEAIRDKIPKWPEEID
tara:strand:- start:2512 stop:3459 length:948 start_codon:yes stop_codon:yes gene_type:complete